MQYLAPPTGKNTDRKSGSTYGGSWGIKQILFPDLRSQLNAESRNFVEMHLLMNTQSSVKARAAACLFFPCFPRRTYVLTAVIRT